MFWLFMVLYQFVFGVFQQSNAGISSSIISNVLHLFMAHVASCAQASSYEALIKDGFKLLFTSSLASIYLGYIITSLDITGLDITLGCYIITGQENRRFGIRGLGNQMPPLLGCYIITGLDIRGFFVFYIIEGNFIFIGLVLL